VTHRGPFQPPTFCDSVTAAGTNSCILGQSGQAIRRHVGGVTGVQRGETVGGLLSWYGDLLRSGEITSPM